MQQSSPSSNLAEQEKLPIRPLHDKCHYGVWKIRVEAACSAKDLNDALLSASAAGCSLGQNKFVERQRQASSIYVGVFGDHALRGARTVNGKPKEMIEKLDARYRSQSTASKTTKISELVSVRFRYPKAEIAKHIDGMAGIVEELRNMDGELDETLTVGTLVASIEVSELALGTAAVKTLAKKNIKWQAVSGSLIKEWKAFSFDTSKVHTAKVEKLKCTFCNRLGHKPEGCWSNPQNPNNRLGRSKADNKGLRQNGNSATQRDSAEQSRQTSNGLANSNPKQRSAWLSPSRRRTICCLTQEPLHTSLHMLNE